MKRVFSLFTTMLLCSIVAAYGQQTQSASVYQNQVMTDAAQIAASIANTPTTEKIGTFDCVEISGGMQVSLIRVAEGEDAKIFYDTKGLSTTKFKYEVDKKGVLKIEEPIDSERKSPTEVKVYYRNLRSLTVANASLTLDKMHRGDMLDIAISGGAKVQAKIDVNDLAIEVTGRSSVVLEGQSRYMDLKVSTAKCDAKALMCMSIIADASHGAEVSLFVTERLQATTSTSANISYLGEPSIVRVHSSLFGGDIISLDN